MGGSEGQAEDIRVEAEQILKIKGTLVTMCDTRQGGPPTQSDPPSLNHQRERALPCEQHGAFNLVSWLASPSCGLFIPTRVRTFPQKPPPRFTLPAHFAHRPSATFRTRAKHT
eukprot:scaffold31507_cov101-Isochrysis_galbana.AAC.6